MRKHKTSFRPQANIESRPTRNQERNQPVLREQRKIGLERGRIGLISDTHGLVRPEALAALQGVELIVHAGDIGKPEVLEALETVAPVAAIKGNNDTALWSRRIPEILDLELNETGVRVIHNVNELKKNLLSPAIHVVISGHSHKPAVERRDHVLFVNPGSAGPRRFKLPVAIGLLQLGKPEPKAEIIRLL